MGSAVGFDRPVSDYYKNKTDPYDGLSILEMQSLFYFIVYSLGICLIVNIVEIIAQYLNAITELMIIIAFINYNL